MLALCALSLGLGGSVASAVGPSPGGFARDSGLARGGHNVQVIGLAPVCARGDRIFLTALLTQGKRRASGAWPIHACTGKRGQWQALLSTSTAGALRPGGATGFASATIKRHGRTLSTKRWSAPLRLIPARTGVSRSPETASAYFSVGSGEVVSIVGGGGATGISGSNCTDDETVATFVTKGDNERHDFQITPRSGGTCTIQESYSNFEVSVRGHGINGTGRMFLGEYSFLGGYFSSCYSGQPQSVAYHQNYVWSGLACASTGDFRLNITLK